jgi:D-glycero-D-manno-heptose 1,7-bisphosphate phosphatase
LSSARKRGAVFLDRDGVINRRLPGAYVRRWEEFRFLRGVREGLRLLKEAGYLLVVFTNQRGIGRGLMEEADLDAVHRRMGAELAKSGAAVDAIYHCPHLIEADCDCRKPKPGMLLRALAEHPIDPGRSWVIGDSLSDIAAGRAVGIPGVLVVPRGAERLPGVATAVSLLAAARAILGDTRVR